MKPSKAKTQSTRKPRVRGMNLTLSNSSKEREQVVSNPARDGLPVGDLAGFIEENINEDLLLQKKLRRRGIILKSTNFNTIQELLERYTACSFRDNIDEISKLLAFWILNGKLSSSNIPKILELVISILDKENNSSDRSNMLMLLQTIITKKDPAVAIKKQEIIYIVLKTLPRSPIENSCMWITLQSLYPIEPSDIKNQELIDYLAEALLHSKDVNLFSTVVCIAQRIMDGNSSLDVKPIIRALIKKTEDISVCEEILQNIFSLLFGHINQTNVNLNEVQQILNAAMHALSFKMSPSNAILHGNALGAAIKVLSISQVQTSAIIPSVINILEYYTKEILIAKKSHSTEHVYIQEISQVSNNALIILQNIILFQRPEFTGIRQILDSVIGTDIAIKLDCVSRLILLSPALAKILTNNPTTDTDLEYIKNKILIFKKELETIKAMHGIGGIIIEMIDDYLKRDTTIVVNKITYMIADVIKAGLTSEKLGRGAILIPLSLLKWLSKEGIDISQLSLANYKLNELLKNAFIAKDICICNLILQIFQYEVDKKPLQSKLPTYFCDQSLLINIYNNSSTWPDLHYKTMELLFKVDANWCRDISVGQLINDCITGLSNPSPEVYRTVAWLTSRVVRNTINDKQITDLNGLAVALVTLIGKETACTSWSIRKIVTSGKVDAGDAIRSLTNLCYHGSQKGQEDAADIILALSKLENQNITQEIKNCFAEANVSRNTSELSCKAQKTICMILEQCSSLANVCKPHQHISISAP